MSVNAELFSLIPNQCQTCRPIGLVIRTVGSLVVEGRVSLGQAQAFIQEHVDPNCVGPKPDDECDGSCSKPNCARATSGPGEEGTYFTKLNRLVVDKGLPTGDDDMGVSIPEDVKQRTVGLASCEVQVSNQPVSE